MSVVFVLVFVAIIMASAFLVAFIWAVRNGQYEDTYTPSVRILFDDPEMKQDEKAELKEREKAQEKVKEKVGSHSGQ